MKFCDYSCEFVDISDMKNTSDACRREMLLYCRKFQRAVKKNSICIENKLKKSNKSK
jgi:hypothetical protein